MYCILFYLLNFDFSVLRGEVQSEVCEGGDDGPVPPLLRDVLRGVQVCAVGDLRQQGRVPLLPGQGRQQRQDQTQVPMKAVILSSSH